MKTINSKLSFVLVFAFVATTFLNAQKKEIKASESIVNWTGKKITENHYGTLKLSSGYLSFDGDKITGGAFTVDMTSLQVTDLKPGKGKEKLEGHLNSDDFFSVNKYKTATLIVKSADKMNKGYKLKGDLTIKGKTHPIEFDLSVNGNTASTKLSVDRTKYGIRYGSGSFFDNLGDKVIYDEFELAVNLKM